MSDDPENLNDWRATLNHPAMGVALRIAKSVVRGMILFAVFFTEIVALLLAPIVLILGIGWAVLPAILKMVETQGQPHDLFGGVANAVPREILFGGMAITPTMLILDGVLLIAVAALCRTFETIVSSET
jgi:hypothetical protein